MQAHGEDGSRAAWLQDGMGSWENWENIIPMSSAGKNSGMVSALHLVSSIPVACLAELHTMPAHAAVRSWMLVITLGISTTLPQLSSVLPAECQLAHLSVQVLEIWDVVF